MRASIARANVRISRAVLIPTILVECRSWKMLFRYASKNVALPPPHPASQEATARNNAPGFSRATFPKRFVQVEEGPLLKTESSESLSDLGVT